MIIDFNNNEDLKDYINFIKEDINTVYNILQKINDITAVTCFNNSIFATGADTAKAQLFIKESKKIISDFNKIKKSIKLNISYDFNPDYMIFTKYEKIKKLTRNDFLCTDFFNEFVNILSSLNEINLYCICVNLDKYQCIKY